MNRIVLKSGKEKSVLRRHPWIFSGAVQSVEGDPVPGATVDVLSSGKDFLGRAAYSPVSSIRARMWTFEDEQINTDFLRSRIHAAIEYRRQLPSAFSAKCARRMVFGESDSLPGLIADQYGDFLVVQILSAGMELWREQIVEMLAKSAAVRNVYERSDVDVRELEGLQPRTGLLLGDEPPANVEIIENGLAFKVDIRAGQKTGFYLDQADNRHSIKKYVGGKRILNCFSYSGGFTVYALAGGAQHVLSVDSSETALDTARQNIALNNLDASRADWSCADVFQELRKLRDMVESFDMVILDPPKFAPTSAQIRAAARGYKDINLLAIKLLSAGGLLVTFSCSGGVSRRLFQKIIADAALDADAELRIVENLSQSADHPVALNFPESEYLKGLVCKKR